MQTLFPNKSGDYLETEEEDIIDKIPQTHSGLEILCKYLEENPFCIYGWQTLFSDFDYLMSPKKREQIIKTLTDEFEPEIVRLMLGDSISEDEFFPEEKAMILRTTRTITGIQELLEYLKQNINCLYGWDIYFDLFYLHSTPKQQSFAREILRSTFDEHFLRVRFPQQF